MAKENLHRRKAVALPAATVSVTSDSITLVVPDVVGKNSSHTGGRGGLRFTSSHTKAFRKSVADGVAEWSSTRPLETIKLIRAMRGAWRLEVVGVWPSKRDVVAGKLADFLMPCGDADAAIPQALDALQHAGVLDDDARVVEVRAWNLYRKGVRATVMRLVRVDVVGGDEIEERNVAIAHLLPLVPQSPETPAKPARKRKVQTS
jgi:Holliday junction resolvase RusA-like endonuclease